MSKQLSFLLLTLVLAACGSGGSHFKLEGRLNNMDQGEFYVYDLEGTTRGLDTITVNDGKFAYETVCSSPTTLVMVFPNFSEQPIFAEPGATVEMKGDASHLKELEVTGTDDNKLMNKFRKMIVNSSPAETKEHAEHFVKDHPTSQASAYIVRKYFIANGSPDYKKADELLKFMTRQGHKSALLNDLERDIKPLATGGKGTSLPKFSVYDINGNPVSNASLQGKVGVITTWASWNYDSQNLQRRLRDYVKRSHGNIKVVGICVDPYRNTCRDIVNRDSLNVGPTICDGQMLVSPLLKKLGLYFVPSTMVIENGRITARDLRVTEIEKLLEDKLKTF